MRIPKSFTKSFVLQKDQSDCGVACLLSIIKFHGGDGNLESLRMYSGTTGDGTTLLGLAEAAHANHFNAEGCEGDIELLSRERFPCILYVLIDNLRHFVVYYQCKMVRDNLFFLIGDPARGISWYSAQSLQQTWSRGICLILSPSNDFKKTGNQQHTKRDWLKGLLKDDLPLLMTSISLGIIVTAMGLTLSIFSQKLIDDILPNKNIPNCIADYYWYFSY